MIRLSVPRILATGRAAGVEQGICWRLSGETDQRPPFVVFGVRGGGIPSIYEKIHDPRSFPLVSPQDTTAAHFIRARKPKQTRSISSPLVPIGSNHILSCYAVQYHYSPAPKNCSDIVLLRSSSGTQHPHAHADNATKERLTSASSPRHRPRGPGLAQPLPL